MGRRPSITDEQRKQILQYREEGFSFDDIAELVGCGRETARRICYGKAYPKYQIDSKRRKQKKYAEAFVTLAQFEPKIITDYLKSIGFRGKLERPINHIETFEL